MNTRMAAVLLVALMGLTGSLSGCAAQPPLEDETGWNCLVDGNGHCGRTIHTNFLRRQLIASGELPLASSTVSSFSS